MSPTLGIKNGFCKDCFSCVKTGKYVYCEYDMWETTTPDKISLHTSIDFDCENFDNGE